jgi:hypothetical protein
MIFQIGARVEFRDKTTQDLIGERTGFMQDFESTDLAVGADWTRHFHSWTPKDGFQGILEAGVRRRVEDPPHTGQIGGRVRVIRLSDQVEVENETFTAMVDASELDQTGQWDKYAKIWDVTTNIEGRLQVGVRLPETE